MTKKDLELVYYLKKELKMWNDRLDELNADIALSPKAMDGMPFSKTNGTSDPTQAKAMKIVETNKKIYEIKVKLTTTIAAVEAFIMNVDDSIVRQILEYRCVCNMSWKRIAIKIDEAYMTEENVRQIYHRFISTIE